MLLVVLNFLVIVVSMLMGIKRYFYLRKLKKQSEVSINKVVQIDDTITPVRPVPQSSEIPSVDNFLVDNSIIDR